MMELWEIIVLIYFISAIIITIVDSIKKKNGEEE